MRPFFVPILSLTLSISMLELEKTYLLGSLPEGLASCKKKEMLDIYLPGTSPHPHLRIRKNGDKYEITNKQPLVQGDISKMIEQTVMLTPEEFSELAIVPGKRVHKFRYLYPWNNRFAEVDVFLDQLTGLILVDFEFQNEAEMQNFIPPAYCLTEVTQEEAIAGGFLAGKSCSDIVPVLEKYGFVSLVGEM